MNKQQLLNGLVGTVFTLGVITVAAAVDQSWQYGTSTDTISYGFSGPDSGNVGQADDATKRIAMDGNLPWYYYN